MKKHNIHSDWKDYISVIRKTAESNGITQNDIAEKTGMQQSAISRFFSLRSKPQLDTVLNVIKAVGLAMKLSPNTNVLHNATNNSDAEKEVKEIIEKIKN